MLHCGTHVPIELHFCNDLEIIENVFLIFIDAHLILWKKNFNRTLTICEKHINFESFQKIDALLTTVILGWTQKENRKYFLLLADGVTYRKLITTMSDAALSSAVLKSCVFLHACSIYSFEISLKYSYKSKAIQIKYIK